MSIRHGFTKSPEQILKNEFTWQVLSDNISSEGKGLNHAK